MIITIDGPTASGKSTVARLLAEDLGYYYIASGLLFRALAYLLIHKSAYTIETLYEPRLQDLEQFFDQISYSYDAMHKEQIHYRGISITPLLKTKEIDQASSILSLNPIVRDHIMNLQRSIAKNYDVVVDGRDCGSVVFPYAEVKFFLTASLDVRAKRWQKDQEKRGKLVTLQESEKEVKIRDERDSEREIAPLKVPEGAIMIDNSELDLKQTLEVMKEKITLKRK